MKYEMFKKPTPTHLESSSPAALRLENIEAFLGATRGQLTIGEIPPILRAALAAEGKKMRAALIGHEEETVVQLLQRLDAALDQYSHGGVVVDEVSPEILRRRKP